MKSADKGNLLITGVQFASKMFQNIQNNEEFITSTVRGKTLSAVSPISSI